MNTIKPHLIEDISSLIHDGVPVVFETMLKLNAQPLEAGNFSPSDEEVVVGSLGFVGDANGMVHLHLTAHLAEILAGNMLGLPADGLSEELVNDVVGELSNMVVGAVKSQLCDGGSPCILTIPSVIRGKGFNVEKLTSDERRDLYFSCADECFLITILMKQPNAGDSNL